MARTRVLLITALASAALAAGCGSMGNGYPGIAPSNATVTRVLMQAGASRAPAAAPIEAAPGGVAPVALEVDKPGKRTRARADKAASKTTRSGARTAAPAAAPATAAAGGAAGTAGAAVQYRYLIELDRGGVRSFDFPADQKLHAGDRVFVTDSGQLELK